MHKKKAKIAVAESVATTETATIAATTNTNTPNKKKPKQWNVKPQNNEGVLVPCPKLVYKSSGVAVVDYVVGHGIEPKPGTDIPIDNKVYLQPRPTQPNPTHPQTHFLTCPYHQTPLSGSKVQITYEGSYPDGTIFDAHLKTKQPFVFRKGTGRRLYIILYY